MPRFVKEFTEFISAGASSTSPSGPSSAAFTTVITSFVRDVLTAFIGAIVGKPNFNDLSVSIGHGVAFYGRVHHVGD